MSCASPISQLSPPSLHMYNASLISPLRPNLDDPDPLQQRSPFSFAFPAPHIPQVTASPSSPLVSSPAQSRPVLTDILLQRHRNSPQSPLNKAATVTSPRLPSPRKGFKENRENTGSAERREVENGTTVDVLCSSPSSSTFNKVAIVTSPWLGSPRKVDKENRENTGRVERHEAENGVTIDAICSSPTPSPLKRKRPTKLAIPEFARLASFGKAKEFELREQEQLSSEIHSVEAPLFAVSCKKGRRDCMEDAHTAITNFQGEANQAFFGVFDGHGGKTAAQFAAENLGQHIAMAIQNQKDEEGSLEDAMHAGYLAIDSEFLVKGVNSGTCSISAFVKEGQLVVANAGDCKAVLCRDGQAEALSSMHRASNVEERRRIESLGGYVDCFNGVWRVQGTLAVTRGFGDKNLKQWISAEPEVRQLDITHGCEFLILASDGLWDKVSDQEAVDCAREVLQDLMEKDGGMDSSISRPSKSQKHHYSSFPSSTNKENNVKTSFLKTDACNKLIHKACSRGNLDDITVMVVPLASFAIPRSS